MATRRNDRWAASALISIIELLRAGGNHEQAQSLITCLEIFQSFASNVFAKGSFYEANFSEKDAEVEREDNRIFVPDASTYKIVDDNTISFPCVPLSMILRDALKPYRLKKTEKNDETNEEIRNNPVPGSADTGL